MLFRGVRAHLFLGLSVIFSVSYDKEPKVRARPSNAIRGYEAVSNDQVLMMVIAKGSKRHHNA